MVRPHQELTHSVATRVCCAPDFAMRTQGRRGSSEGRGKLYLVEIKYARPKIDATDARNRKKRMSIRMCGKADRKCFMYDRIFPCRSTISAHHSAYVRTLPKGGVE